MLTTRLLHAPLALALLALLPDSPARADSWIVRPDGTGDFPTIQAAVNAAANGDEILLGDGTFTGEGNRSVSYLGKELTIRSFSGNPASCVMDLGASFLRAFDFEAGDGPLAVLRDVTIQGGHSWSITTTGSPTIENVIFDGFVGAVHSVGGSPAIRMSTFRNGETPSLECAGGGLTLSDCLFEANFLHSSSGPVSLTDVSDAVVERCEIRNHIYIPGSYADLISLARTSATLTDCRFTDNPATAVYSDGGATGATVTVRDCLIENNDSALHLSAPYNGPLSSYLVQGCTVRSNDGLRGNGLTTGGMVDVTVEDTSFEANRWGIRGSVPEFHAGRSLIVRRCTVEGHTQRAIHASFPIMLIEDSVISGNLGNAIELYRYANSPGTATIRGSVVTGNGGSGIRLVELASAHVETSTIATNGSGWTGGVGAGLDCVNGTTASVERSVVWGNCAQDGSEIRVEADSYLDFSCGVLDPSRVIGQGTFVSSDVLNANPLFCDPLACNELPSAAGSYRLDAGSPALQMDCGVPGALPEGCGTVTVEPSSWARIKASYR